jgi:DNA mismatch endonuclease, patch repair protein
MRETPELRARIMRAVKSFDTAPEIVVRSAVHRLGYRFRLRRTHLPGKPDLVFPKLRKAIFVHGCFWHGHHCARGARVPKTNREYWTAKVTRNRRRDRAALAALRGSGWGAAVLWECQLKDRAKLRRRLRDFLERTPAARS